MPTLIDHVSWLQTLAQSNAELERLRASYKFNPLEREAVLGLAHQKGEIVHDRVTDQRATVLSGTRKRLTAVPGAGGE